MEWLRDISTTIFVPLILGCCLLLLAFFCAAHGKKKGYSYWGCFFGCIFGTVPGIIFVLILPDMMKLEDQQSASFRYRDKEIEALKTELEAQKKYVLQLEANLDNYRLVEKHETR